MSAEYQKLSVRDKLAAARLNARQRLPYYAAALLALVVKERPGLGTMGVTADMLLLIDFQWFDKLPLEEAVAALIHEVQHVLRDHAGRCKANGFNPVAWNFAADAELNDDLVPMFPFVGAPNSTWVLPRLFGCPDGQTAEAYYHAARQQQQQQQQGQQGEGEGQDGQGQGDGEGQPQAGRGWCGSGAGRPLPGEPKPGQDERPTSGDGSGGPTPRQGDDGRSPSEVQAVRKAVAEAMKDHAAKGRGSVPDGWLRWADALSEPPKVRWQDKLARSARQSMAYRPGAVDLRYNRPSRRQGGLGFGPGRPILPALVAPIPHVLIAVDTSGSMGTSELSIALREARGVLLRAGAEVTFVACDAAVHEMKKVKDWHELPGLLRGGGGTSFCPIFDAAEKMRDKPDVVIVITDGDGDAPAAPPAGMKTIWLLVGHKSKPCNWGEQILVD